jgi:transposase
LSKCPKCDSKGLKEAGYRRLRCFRCGFEANRGVVGKLNIRQRALKKLKIKVIPGGSLTAPSAPQMTDVNPNRWGDPMNCPEGNLRPLGRGEGQISC